MKYPKLSGKPTGILKNMSNGEINLSVIIVNYRSGKFLKKCLASLHNAPKTGAEIIVVNNDPEEDLSELKKEYREMILVDHKKNVGYGAGNNLGARAARGKFFLFLNPDARIGLAKISSVISNFENDDSVGVIGLKINDSSGRVQSWTAGREAKLSELILNNIGFSRSARFWQSKKKIECDWVAGTAMLSREDIFRKIGGFDENFFMYFEDMDICRRIRNAGKRVVYFPEVSVFHEGGQSYGENKKQQKKHYYNSMEYYFKKHKSRWQWRTIKILRALFFKT